MTSSWIEETHHPVLPGADRPKVSCIMPTADRPQFVTLSIQFFLRQTYEPRELVIVDDGENSVADLLPVDPRIRYIRLTRHNSTGQKRNIACQEATGDIIVHWDDDDWYAPWRLEYQVQALMQGTADVCGLSRILYFSAVYRRAWEYMYPHWGTPWVGGNTLCYFKSLWARNPFADVRVGEDNDFLWKGVPKRIMPLTDTRIVVALLHSRNTSPKRVSDVRWCPLPLRRVTQLLGDDVALYDGAATWHSSVAPTAQRSSFSVRTVKKTGKRSDNPSSHPLVSCLMVTHRREPFVSLAVELFQRQDYPNRELVIVDDGPSPMRALVENDERIRYVHLDSRHSLGDKRNIACVEARGECMVHWDDDDWCSPQRLRYQVEPLLSKRADITGIENSFVMDLVEGVCWRTSRAVNERMFIANIHGATLAFRRELFDQGLRYPSFDLGEDAAFLCHALSNGSRLKRLENPGLYVYMRHSRNAWRFEPGAHVDPSGWQRCAVPLALRSNTIQRYQAAAKQLQSEDGVL